jgi:hypothetical protein
MGMWYVCSSDDWAAFQMYIDAVLTLPIVAQNLLDQPFSQISEQEVGFPSIWCMMSYGIKICSLSTLHDGPYIGVCNKPCGLHTKWKKK